MSTAYDETITTVRRPMTSEEAHGPAIEAVALEVSDPAAARDWYHAAFGLDGVLELRDADEASSGFRGFTLSLVCSQPSNVDALVGAALDAGATSLKPVKKGLWGYGGVVKAPDGTIWKVATSAKKDTGPATREASEIVLLLGVTDFVASKRFYVERGFVIARSFARAYADFEAPSSRVKLALYKRRALAKDAGVSPDGAGSHRLAIRSGLGPFIDPDGFAWEAS